MTSISVSVFYYKLIQYLSCSDYILFYEERTTKIKLNIVKWDSHGAPQQPSADTSRAESVLGAASSSPTPST